jgi:hypothetical protein
LLEARFASARAEVGQFAASIADFVALAIETGRRRDTEER